MIAIIDYDIGNVRSVSDALDRCGAEWIVTRDADVIRSASGIVFPGVGAAGQGMKNLYQFGLVDLLHEAARRQIPLLGICLGMQLLFSHSEEGDVACLNLIPGRVKRLGVGLKVPHIGWNQISVRNHEKPCLFSGVPDGSCVYFLHSYICIPESAQATVATCNYSDDFSAAVHSNSIYGIQFHPEKSSVVGQQILTNFCSLCK